MLSHFYHGFHLAHSKKINSVTSNNNLRVGIYIGCSKDDPENIEKQLIAWGNYLEEYDVDLYGAASPPDSVKEYYNYLEMSGENSTQPLYKIFSSFKHTIQYITARNPDVVIQIWDYPSHAPGVCLAADIKNTASIVRYSGDHLAEYRFFRGLKKGLAFGLNNVLGSIPFRLADGVITLGPYGKTEIKKRISAQNSIKMIPPATGIEERFIPPKNKNQIRNDLDLPTNKQIVLYVGRITEKKGIPFLQKVIDEFSKDDEIMFVLVGDGEYASQIKKSSPPELVRFSGYVPYHNIHRYFQAANVYVHPSKYEGIPQTILEALNCDVPVVARKAGDIEYIIEDIVETPYQMAEKISNRGYELEWKNKHEFSEKVQRQKLKELLIEVSEKSGGKDSFTSYSKDI